jgi:hypothetical protein
MPRSRLILFAALAVAVALVVAFAMRGAAGAPALARRPPAGAATPFVRDLSTRLRRCDAVLAQTSGPALASAQLTLTPRGDATVLTQTVRVAGWGTSDALLAVLAPPGAGAEQVAFVTVATADVRPIANRFSTPLLPRMTPDRLSVVVPDASGGPGATQFTVVDRRGARLGAMVVNGAVLDVAVISRDSDSAMAVSLADYALVYDLASNDPIERVTTGAARAMLPRPGTDALSFVLADRVVHDACAAPFPAGAFYRAAWSADGRYLAVLMLEGEMLPAQSALLVWDTKTGVVREAMRDAGVAITGLTWHPRINTVLLSAAALESPEREWLWQFNPETHTASVVVDTPLYAPAYWGIAFDPEGARLAVGCPTPDATSGVVTRGAICLYDVTLP